MDCCHFKKENMELYKLNLPNETVNNIINYSKWMKKSNVKIVKRGEIINF